MEDVAFLSRPDYMCEPFLADPALCKEKHWSGSTAFGLEFRIWEALKKSLPGARETPNQRQMDLLNLTDGVLGDTG